MQIPDWLIQENSSFFPSKNRGIGQNWHQFVEKTLNNVAHLLESSISSERYASIDGFLQRIDPRAKLLGILSVVVLVTLIQNILILISLYVVTLILAVMGKISIKFFLKRVWLTILFAGIMAFPSIFNMFTPGESILVLARFDQPVNFWIFHFDTISITREGSINAIKFIFRVATTVSLVVLLTLTTRWEEILKALRIFGVPQVFVLTLSMTYQYIILLARTVQEIYFAKKARTLSYSGPSHNIRNEQRWTASRLGVILKKTYNQAEEIQEAMIARGFHGEVCILNKFSFHKRDLLWGAFIILIIIGTIILNLSW